MSGSGNRGKDMSGTGSIENHFSLRLLKFFMKVTGMWPVENTREKLISDLALLYTTAIVTIGLTAQSIDFYYSFGDLQALAYNIPTTISVLIEFIKLSKFIMNRSEVMDFNAYIEKIFWKVDYNAAEYKILEECNRMSMIMVVLQLVFSQSLVWLYVSIPIAESAGKNTTERTLPITLYFDFPFTDSPFYEMAFILETIAGVAVGVCTTTFAGFLGTTNFYAAGQFRILQRRLEYAVSNDGNIENPNTAAIVYQNYSNVRNCIKQHQVLILYIARIEKLFSMLLLTQAMGSVVLLCFCGLQILLGDARTSIFRLLFSVQFFIIATVQLFLFSWPCHEIMIESQEVAEGAYRASWYCLSYTKEGKMCRQSLSVVILRARKPCNLTVGKFAPMSLQTFGSIFNTAMSYFTVLRQMNEENN